MLGDPRTSLCALSQEFMHSWADITTHGLLASCPNTCYPKCCVRLRSSQTSFERGSWALVAPLVWRAEPEITTISEYHEMSFLQSRRSGLANTQCKTPNAASLPCHSQGGLLQFAWSLVDANVARGGLGCPGGRDQRPPSLGINKLIPAHLHQT